MALNPLRDTLGLAGWSASQHDSSFKPEADAALARFQALRDDLERQVRRGDLTVKIAREQAAAAAARLKADLAAKAEGYSPVPRVFLDRLVEASNARSRLVTLVHHDGGWVVAEVRDRTSRRAGSAG